MLTDFLDSVRSFALARVLMAAIELDIFRILEEQGPLGRAELREHTGIKGTPISDNFFDILVVFSALKEEDGKLSLSPMGRSVLPVYKSIKSWNDEMRLFYESLRDLAGLLKSGRFQDSALSEYWAYKNVSDRKALQASAVDDYSSVMAASQDQLSQIVVEQYDFSVHEHVIDFGGGYGRLALTLAERHPDLKITIADLPAVGEGARARIEEAGLQDRIKFLPVDFFRDDLPAGVADAMLFVRVLHDWNDDEVASLMARTRPCLRKSGAVVIVEPMRDNNVKPDPGSVLSGLMLTLLGGRRRNVQHYIELLHSSGYTEVSWRDCGFSLYKMVVSRIA